MVTLRVKTPVEAIQYLYNNGGQPISPSLVCKRSNRQSMLKICTPAINSLLRNIYGPFNLGKKEMKDCLVRRLGLCTSSLLISYKVLYLRKQISHILTRL